MMTITEMKETYLRMIRQLQTDKSNLKESLKEARKQAFMGWSAATVLFIALVIELSIKRIM